MNGMGQEPGQLARGRRTPPSPSLRMRSHPRAGSPPTAPALRALVQRSCSVRGDHETPSVRQSSAAPPGPQPGVVDEGREVPAEACGVGHVGRPGRGPARPRDHPVLPREPRGHLRGPRLQPRPVRQDRGTGLVARAVLLLPGGRGKPGHGPHPARLPDATGPRARVQQHLRHGPELVQGHGGPVRGPVPVRGHAVLGRPLV